MTSPSPISMEETHAIAAQVAGELSLAIVRQKGSKAQMLSWAERLEDVAARLRAKVGGAGVAE